MKSINRVTKVIICIAIIFCFSCNPERTVEGSLLDNNTIVIAFDGNDNLIDFVIVPDQPGHKIITFYLPDKCTEMKAAVVGSRVSSDIAKLKNSYVSTERGEIWLEYIMFEIQDGIVVSVRSNGYGSPSPVNKKVLGFIANNLTNKNYQTKPTTLIKKTAW